MPATLFRISILTPGPEPSTVAIYTIPAAALCEGIRFGSLVPGLVIQAEYIGPEPADLERQRLLRAGWIPPGKHCSCCEHFDWPGE